MTTNRLPTYSKASLERAGYIVKPSTLHRIDISVIAHFGNIPVLELIEAGGRVIFGGYNCQKSLGSLLGAVVELLDLEKEDGVWLSEIEDVPMGIVAGPDGRIVGFGNMFLNEFVLNEQLILWALGEADLYE